MKKLFILLFMTFSSIVVYAQSPKKVKISNGILNPISAIDFTGKGVKSLVQILDNEAIANEFKTKGYSLKVNGVNEGDDYKLVFFIGNLKTYNKIDIERTPAIAYSPKISASSETKAFLLNDKNEIIWIFKARPNEMNYEHKLAYQASEELANKSLEQVTSEIKASVLKKYCIEMLKVYQQNVNSCIGKSVIENPHFKLYTLKDKKNEYGDFNDATEKLALDLEDPFSVDATVVDNAVAVWSKYEKKYMPGKKSDVCDENIDEIYMNLATGYWLKGDGENLKKYYNKFTETEGNRTLESVVSENFRSAISSYEYLKENKTPKVIAINNEIIESNNRLIFRGILSNYLSAHANGYVYRDILPKNSDFIAKMSKTVIDEKRKVDAKYDYTFEDYGRITSINVSYLTDSVNKATKNLLMEYDKNGNLSSIYDKGKEMTLFSFEYNDDLSLKKFTKNEVGPLIKSIYTVSEPVKNSYVFNVKDIWPAKKTNMLDTITQTIVFDKDLRIEKIQLRPHMFTYILCTSIYYAEHYREHNVISHELIYQYKQEVDRQGVKETLEFSLGYCRDLDFMSNITEVHLRTLIEKFEIEYMLPSH